MRSLLAFACLAALGAACAAGARPSGATQFSRARWRAASRSPSTSPAERRARPALRRSSRTASSTCSRTAGSAPRRSSTSGASSRPAESRGCSGSRSTLRIRRCASSTCSSPKRRLDPVVEFRTNGTTRPAPRQLFSSRDPYGNHNGGMLAFGPAAGCTSGWATAAPAAIRRTASQNMRSLFGKLLSHQRGDEGAQDRGARPAQPVAVLVRPGERRPLHRRRRPGRRSRRSTTRPRAAPASRTTAGTSTRAARSSRTSPWARAFSSPVAQYPHSQGFSVTGGYVYRGSRRRCGGATSTATTAAASSGASARPGQGVRRPGVSRFRVANLSSFGQDAAGELYAVSHEGTVYRLTP